MTIIEKAIQEGFIRFNEDKSRITYIKQKFEHNYGEGEPEEYVRLNAYLELLYDYGYKAKNIKFEVLAQQGSSGKTRADIVIYHDNSESVFAVIETKEANTSDKENDIYKQARSYSYSDELKTSTYFAYKIGENNMKVFLKPHDEEKIKLPYDYDSKIVYAYLVEDEPVPPPPPHYQVLKASSPYDLKQIFKSCHDIIWDGVKNEQDAFDEFSKLLFLKMFDEIECEEQHLKQYLFQTKDYETADELYSRITKEYKRAIKDRKVEQILTHLNITVYQLKDIVKKLEPISLIDTDNDPKGLAFETFTKAYMKGEFGQFFTPRNIVEFMLNVSPIVWSSKFTNKSKVLDPCCGSGSFLVHSIGQFKNRYKKTKYWQQFANNSVYGVEKSDKISVTAKINFALHDDGHDNILNIDGLNTPKKWEKGSFDLILTNPPFGSNIKNLKKPKDLKAESLKHFYDYEKYDITTKFPDEIDVLSGRAKDPNEKQGSEYTNRKYGIQISSEIIFFELYYDMLKEDGIAEVVVPDSILTNSSSQDVRDWIQTHFQILAVISLPQFAFSHYGAGVKSSIIFIKKHNYKTTIAIKTAKLKYLEIALSENRNDLDILYKELKNVENTYSKIINLNQKQADELAKIQQLHSDNKSVNEKHTKQIIAEYKKKVKEIKDSEEFKEWLKAQKEDINEQIKALKDTIYELAENGFTKYEKELNYPIFMAIADHIGYDATGRDTSKNDLTETISEELTKFLKHQIEHPDRPFI